MRNIRQKQCSQFPPVHDFGIPRWGVAYVPCITNLRALYAWVIQWHVAGMLSLAEHWQGRRAMSNHVCAISMWHVVCLQHLARACSEQSRSTSVLPINHVVQMPQCLSGFVNHDYSREFWTKKNGPWFYRLAFGSLDQPPAHPYAPRPRRLINVTMTWYWLSKTKSKHFPQVLKYCFLLRLSKYHDSYPRYVSYILLSILFVFVVEVEKQIVILKPPDIWNFIYDCLS